MKMQKHPFGKRKDHRRKKAIDNLTIKKIVIGENNIHPIRQHLYDGQSNENKIIVASDWLDVFLSEHLSIYLIFFLTGMKGFDIV